MPLPGHSLFLSFLIVAPTGHRPLWRGAIGGLLRARIWHPHSRGPLFPPPSLSLVSCPVSPRCIMSFSQHSPPLHHGPRPCLPLRLLLPLSCRRGAYSVALGSRSPPCRLGHYIDADASLHLSTPAALRLRSFLCATAFFGASVRLVPNSAPRRVLPSPRCSSPPRAPRPPLAHAVVEPAGSFLGRRPLLPGVLWVPDCPSLAGRAPPSFPLPLLVVGPYLWLLHFPGTKYSINFSSGWLRAFAARVTQPLPMARHTANWGRGRAPLARHHVATLGVPTHGKTHGAAQYITDLSSPLWGPPAPSDLGHSSHHLAGPLGLMGLIPN